MMSYRISNFLDKALYFTLLLFLVSAFVLSIHAFFNPDMHFFQLETNYMIFALILLLLFLSGLFIISKKTDEDKKTINKTDEELSQTNLNDSVQVMENIRIKDVVFVFMSAFFLRLCFVFFFGYFVYPYSDFLWAHLRGLNLLNPNLYELWSGWAIFSIILRIIYVTIPHYITAQFVNIIVTSITAVIIYVLALKILSKRNIALAAAVIFAFYPPNILYNTILTPEHIALLLTCIGILFLLMKRQSFLKQCVFCVLAGILCAFSDSLKAMALIMIIAYIITSILACFTNRAVLPLEANKDIGLGKLLSKLFILFAILTATYSVTLFAVERTAEHILGIEFTSPANRRASVFFIGLQPSGEGQVHLGNNPRLYLTLVEETGGDFDLAREMMYDFLWQDIRENPGEFALLFPRKFRWAWQDDVFPAYHVWLTTHRHAETLPQITEYISVELMYISENVLSTVSQIFYIALVGLSIVGVFGAFRRNFNYGFFYISLYLFGFFLLLLIAEAQSRYKIMIIPFLCIMAAYGFNLLLCKAQNFKYRKI